MKDVEPIETYTPKQTADMLHITASTLRKYCALVTKYHGQEYFNRDATNARIFSRHDVDLLKRMIELKKAPHVTLDDAVMIALQQDSPADTVTLTTPTDTSDKAGHLPGIAALQHVVMDQNKQIQQLMDLNAQLMQSNDKLSQDVQALLDRMDNAALNPPPGNKPTLFQRLFSRP